jgi:pseudaminic acid synthase
MLGKKNKPYLVAEISSNHDGVLENAKKLILEAKIFGADAVKLQTYTPQSMTIKSNKNIFKIKEGLWKGYSLWDLYKKAHTPYKWHKELFNYARKIRIKIFSTPFDEKAVDFLEKLECPFYKVASFEMTDIPLIKKIASTKKRIIISTGMASLKEIETTYNYAKLFGIKKITLLYCVSKYPSKIKDFNLNNIKIMKKKFNCEIGFSDHSTDNNIASAASLAGATVIEKHISLKKINALDSQFSISGEEILNYKYHINNPRLFIKKKIYDRLLGKRKFYRSKTEDKSKIFRRSIFIVKDIKKGDTFNNKNLKKIRPGFGIPPVFYEKIIGQKSNINIKKGNPLSVSLVKKTGIILNEKIK